MAGRVFVDLGMSLDGFIAGPNAGPHNPLGDHGTDIHQWIYKTAVFRERLSLGGGGETSADDAIARETFARAGAYIMGRRMFDEGEVGWPEEAPFHAPVFVLTHSPREPWVRPGGTTFYFVTDGIHSALEQAKSAAGEKDVQISGGAETVRQCVEAGLVDDLQIHVAPLLLGDGVRLSAGLAKAPLSLTTVGVCDSFSGVTHLRFRIPR